MTQLFKDKIELVFAIAAVTFVFLTFVGGLVSYSPVPYMDMWNGYLDFYVKATTGDWNVWWSQHNEHRIFLARLLFWIDLSLFNGQGWFLILTNYILLSLVCFIFWQIWKEKSINSMPWMGFFLIAWLYSWSQQENLIWGFQSQFILAQLVPIAAFYYTHRTVTAGMHQSRDFYLAVLFGLLAIGTMANGVLALPIMTLYSIITRMGWKRCTFLAVLSVAALWLYFHGFKSPEHHGSLNQALRDNPLGLLRYVLLYIGAPFYYPFNQLGLGQAVATIAGIFMVVSSVAFAWRLVPVANKATLSLALLAFIFYVGGTALGTAGGRLMFGVEQALSSRYMTPTLMAWAALLLLYLPWLETVRQSMHSRIWISFLLLVLLMVPQQFKALEPMQDVLFEREIAALALELGVNDEGQISTVFPFTNWVRSTSEVPIEKNLSIFGVFPIKDARESVGQALTQPLLASHQCQGYIDEIQAINGDANFLRIRGWFFDPNQLNSPRTAQLVDEKGVVQGVVVTGQTRPDVANTINRTAINSGFKGYVKVDVKDKSVVMFDPVGGCYLPANFPAM